ncbi:MAG: phosphate acetyltransferase [Pseudomonadota bacterium]
MSYIFFVAPTGAGVGLTSVCLGLVRAMDQVGVSVGFCKPIEQRNAQDKGPERSTTLLNAIMGLKPAKPLSFEYAQQKMENRLSDQLMEEVIQIYEQSNKHYDVMVVEGLTPSAQDNFIMKLNVHIARTLNSDVILVSAQAGAASERFNNRIRRTASLFGGLDDERVVGCIINKIGDPGDAVKPFEIVNNESASPQAFDPQQTSLNDLAVFQNQSFKALGLLPWNPGLNAPRVLDVHRYLNTKVINEGELHTRRIMTISICALTVRNVISSLSPGTLIVTPGDREDILMAASLSAMNGIPLAGIVLTGNLLPNEKILDLCKPALQSGLPVLLSAYNTFNTAKALDNMDIEVPSDDIQRMEGVMDSVAQSIDAEWLKQRAHIKHEARLSPPAFRYSLVKRARAAQKRIVLPEGEEPRTIKAAIYCQQHNIAQCVLLGDLETINTLAQAQGLDLPDTLEVIAPKDVKQAYIAPMVERRKHKHLTEPMAEAQLEDSVVLGTMMLALDKVDGLVSGAVNTTANTVRPAMQLIKTKADASLVSSIFFMCLPEQVLVYGDCAINPDPSAEQLADIAIQSGDSAIAFGIEPRIAMISYSTGQSGAGSDVDKVREATRIARHKRPDMLIDGPLQYDAASVASVAAKKAPDSPVAGRATVFIFPDLNTGNTTYKAVQRSASVVSIGPMLQGLRKPVNDLSRGALVEDIVYTIALTAIQAV